jgi:hypothetical protein
LLLFSFTNEGQEAIPTCPHGLINGRLRKDNLKISSPHHMPMCLLDPTQKKPKGVGILSKDLKKKTIG